MKTELAPKSTCEEWKERAMRDKGVPYSALNADEKREIREKVAIERNQRRHGTIEDEFFTAAQSAG